ncbi:glycoside hydrolase family 3 C-terminal domain-containing protein [Mariniluteicoccus flavus]
MDPQRSPRPTDSPVRPKDPGDIDALLGELSLEEKAALTCGSDMWHTAPVARLDIPAVLVSDGPHGLRTQLGEVHDLGGAEPATCFPTAVTLAASWDPDLVREVGAAIGDEARDLGVGVVLGPGVNIKRSPLCGRNFEYFSEDPLVAGELGLALVDGIQSRGVGTSLKHFAANNQETDRARVSADVSERALREIYLPAFERIVTGGQPWTVMCAYNQVNGVPASRNRWLLTEVLRDEWGFEGLVVSDWGAVDGRVPALAAGLDLEMPPDLERSPAAVVAAVRAGELDEAVLDTAVRRVLELVLKATGAERSPSERQRVEEPGGAERSPSERQRDEEPLLAHRPLARRAAAESLVLLENDGLLPIDPGQSVAVVGRFAEHPRFQGDGSSRVNPAHQTSLLEAFAEARLDITYAPGFGRGDEDLGDADAERVRLRDEAASVACGADVVVMMLGLTEAEESEGFDRTHLDLPPEQLACLQAVVEANANVVVVLSHGGVVRMPWRRSVKAILDCGLAGQESGGAVADVLTGAVNPSGRLAETVPVELEHVPSFLHFPGQAGHVAYAEDVFVGYRGYEATGREVAYPFGHGLSYTQFANGDPRLTVTGSVEGGDLRVDVEVEVTNTGHRAGRHVVQLFVAPPASREVKRPKRELRAFAKVSLEPGETVTARLALDARAFAYWSEVHGRFAVESGTYAIKVGVRTTRFDLDAPSPVAELHADSSVKEWMAHPEGSAALRREIGIGDDDPWPGMLGSAEMIMLMGDFPLRRIATQPYAPIGPEGVERTLRSLGRG